MTCLQANGRLLFIGAVVSAGLFACGGPHRQESVVPQPTAALAQTVSASFQPMSTAETDAEFGASVAQTDSLVFVGAPNAIGSTGQPTGAVFVMQKGSSGWENLARITPPADTTIRRFGESIAVDGDRILIGAPGSGTAEQGTVHLYERQGNEFFESTRLGQPIGDWKIEARQWRQFGPFTNQGSPNLTVSISGTGDADLYTRLGAAPTTADYDCRPYYGSSLESCELKTNGAHSVSVRGYQAFSTFGVQLAVPSFSFSVSAWKHFGPITIQKGQKIRVQTDGTGDPDLYFRRGAPPTDVTYDCNSSSSTPQEFCQSDAAGDYYVSIFGYRAGTVSLTISIEDGNAPHIAASGDRFGAALALKRQ